MRKTSFTGIALGLALLMLVVSGLARISFDVDILKLLPSNLRQVEGLSLFLKNFAQSDELIITLDAPTPEKAEAAADGIAEALSRRSDLVQRALARAPWEKQPADLAEMLAFLALNQPPEKIRELAARLSPAQASETLRGTLEKLTDSVSPQEIGLSSYDPYDLVGSVVGPALLSGGQQSEFSSPDGTFRVIYVTSAKKFANYNQTIAWMDEIRRVAAPWQQREGCKIAFTGEPAFVAAISASMQSDMMSSGIVTLLVIALIFLFCYRRFRPLFELQAMLVLIFVLALAAAGWLLSELTAVGVGCAAIMIGLSVDYGYFIYHRALGFTGAVRELQRQCLQYIAWTAGTTAAAFFALNVSSLPGLSQLGNLVGIGVVVGAVVMLTVFAPLVLRRQRREAARPASYVERLVVSPRFYRVGAWVTLALTVALLAALVIKGPPGADFSSKPLRPRNSEAYAALDHLSERLMTQGEPLSLVVRGASVDETLARLRSAEDQLASAGKRGEAQTCRTALLVWPVPANQRENLPALSALAADVPRLAQSASDAGFKDEAFALDGAILRQWAAWSAQATPIWPDNDASRWILRRLVKRADGWFLALGIVTPTPGKERELGRAVGGEGIYLAGWSVLTGELRDVIPREFLHAVLGIVLLVLGLLSLAFRDWRAVGLFVVTTALVFACLTGAMSLLGMQWNIFNLAALLLLLGTGTDYSILLLLALRRNGGDVLAARRELALVVALCASSASAGFGTIGWANHAGLASLGQTCALGLLIDAAISIFLLPLAWNFLGRRRLPRELPAGVVAG